MQSHLTNCDCDLCRIQCVPITLTADATQILFVPGRIILPAIPTVPLVRPPGQTPRK